MTKPTVIPNIRNITISGRIATGASTLAHHLSQHLGWEFLDGGKLFRKFTHEQGLNIVATSSRPDEVDLAYEERIKTMLKTESHKIVQSHLAGYDAQGIPGVFKILLLCEDEFGNDKTDIRIDRLANRDDLIVEQAKNEVIERERQNLEKWQRLYADGDTVWVYWDKNYYDLVINTYSHNAEESLAIVLRSVGLQKEEN